MTGTVAQIIRILDRLAPSRLAESWDNVGLQLGNPAWPVKKIWTALDPLPEVVADACENDVDVLVTHHPLFFKPLQRIDCGTPQGRIVETALSRRLAIISAHTNLDSVPGGVNDILAAKMGLGNLRALGGPVDVDMVKLVIFVPLTHVRPMLDALFALDAGRIGKYRCCTFRSEGVGTFWPDGDATPAVGKRNTLSEVKESRIEIIVAQNNLGTVVDALKKVHPYETMAHDVYPLAVRDHQTGLGRVGQLPSPVALEAFSARLKAALNLSTVKVVGQPDVAVETVAVCSGSGASLMAAAVASGAQAYVSGDLGYHTARDAQQAGIGLIDIGHFGSEHLIVDVLAGYIRDALKAAGLSATVEAADTETDPFHYL
ncbi:GTP cyclohydrolase 1 type 2 [Desulfosarcina alkanivorans]|jgi:dinuclear metal center YbgI/SA1388 family protein|uniref:GTP cyclohydrolase 1 type 2 homolog n=1 Tax=Desulfosarcina alkanivorans TaxID=571177 RepID=A0A5K7YDA7_9BACT|nr:Nif3-like dinuclear metal center hexameric protein [Desulfosarcina alkanivorans]BBO67462.1 GTP cyclohydrolase 1 type 2 [Desulfosarcina alkanivorans]